MEVFALQSTSHCSPSPDGPAMQDASISSSGAQGPFQVVTLYRFSQPTKQIRLRVRMKEGGGGTIRAQLVAATQPKTAHQVEIPIKPLALHVPARAGENLCRDGAQVELRVEGAFSMNQMHDWVQGCLPGVPGLAAGQTDDETVTFEFRNVVLGTGLSLKYTKGSATFTSASPHTICVLREFMLRKAEARNVKLKFSCVTHGDIAEGVVKAVEQKLKTLALTEERTKLVQAFDEIRRAGGGDAVETELACFSLEDQEVIRQRERYGGQMQQTVDALETIREMVVDIAEAMASLGTQKLAGSEKEQLRFLLDSNDFHSIADFMRRAARRMP